MLNHQRIKHELKLNQLTVLVNLETAVRHTGGKNNIQIKTDLCNAMSGINRLLPPLIQVSATNSHTEIAPSYSYVG